MRALPAELVDDVGGAAPVRVDQAPANLHGRAVVALPFAAEQIGGERIEAGVDATFESCSIGCVCQRVSCVTKREVRALLVGVGSVVDNVAGEIVFPCGNDVEQEFALHVDERGEMVAGDGDG